MYLLKNVMKQETDCLICARMLGFLASPLVLLLWLGAYVAL
jgi:hypothetical protein